MSATYDFDAAERYFTGILARGGPADAWTVQARLGLYRVALASGDNTRSSLVAIALQEARSIGDRGSEMDALIGLSNTRGIVGGFATAGLGMLALRLGDLPTAAQRFEEAARISDSLGQKEGAMIVRENRDEVMAASGDLEGAREAFLGTLEESEQNGYYGDALFARQHLAAVAIRQGDYGEAEREISEASEELERWRASLGEYDAQGPAARVLAALAEGGG